MSEPIQPEQRDQEISRFPAEVPADPESGQARPFHGGVSAPWTESEDESYGPQPGGQSATSALAPASKSRQSQGLKSFDDVSARAPGAADRRSRRPFPRPPGLTSPSARTFLTQIRRNKWWTLLSTILLGALALFLSNLKTPIYQSKVSVLVQPLTSAIDRGDLQANLKTEKRIASSFGVAARVIDALKLDISPTVLVRALSVDDINETEILEFSYQDSSPREAQRRANAFAKAYLTSRNRDRIALLKTLPSQIQFLQRRLQQLGRQADTAANAAEVDNLRRTILTKQVELAGLDQSRPVGKIIQPAGLPLSPASPKPVANTIFGILAGLMLGLTVPLVRDRLNGRIYSPEDVESRLWAPVLAVVPRVRSLARKGLGHLTTPGDASSPAAAASHAYAMLHANLASAAEGSSRVILITSPLAKEGTTTTVANLGLVLARAGNRVIVVSADLSDPRLDAFGEDQSLSLSQILQEQRSLRATLIPTKDGKLKLLGGDFLRDQGGRDGQLQMQELIGRLTRLADFVLIDCAPIMSAPNVISLSPLADELLIVVSPKSAREDIMTASRRHLERASDLPIGAVLNNFPRGALATHAF